MNQQKVKYFNTFERKRCSCNLYNKRACPTKNEPQQGISYLERERAGVRERERERGWLAGRSAGRHI
jgi:hypothetical protein